MAAKKANPEEVVSMHEIETAWLYQRSGFESGAFLRDIFPAIGPNELRDLLVDVVVQHVLPQLDQRVQILHVPGVHNPVRATVVDSTMVSWNAERGIGPAITPARVRVSTQAIYECARKRRLAVPQEAI